MGEFVRKLFGTDFMPHVYCLREPLLIWLHVLSDGLVAISYFLIPLALLALIRKRRDLAYPWMFALFGLFILSCGTAHAMAIWTLWHPVYRLEAVVKAITAMASLPTAIVLWSLLPRAIRMPGPNDWREMAGRLQAEVRERERAESALRVLNADLELRVAERTQALEEVNQRLAQRERGFRLLFEQNPQPMWVFDPESLRFLAVNDAAVAHYGWSRDEFLSMTVAEVRPDLERFRVQEEQSFSIDVRYDSHEPWVHRRKDGTLIEVDVTHEKVEFEGRAARLVLVRDVTNERAAVRAVRESEARLTSVLDGAPVVIYLKDIEGRHLFVNRRFTELFGFSREQMRGRTDFDVFPAAMAEVIRANDEQVIRLAEPQEFEESTPNELGGRVYQSIKFPLRTTEGTIYALCAISTDVTDRKMLEQRLNQAAKMEAVGQLAGGIAHDFNNLLTVILGNASWAMEMGPEDVGGPMEQITQAAMSAAALTGKLLAFSRKQVLQPQVLKLNAVLTGMQAMVRRLVREDIEIRISLNADPGYICADASSLEQVILNLVANASDAMPDGGRIDIETRNTTVRRATFDPHFAVQPGEYTVLTVADNGVGMDQATRERIFEPFFTTKAKGRGTGLGLATVFGIVRQSGGFINVESGPGRGTIFTACFPSAAEAPAAVAEAKVAKVTVPPARVLVAEDEDALRQLIVATLTRQGHEVHAAGTGMAAVSIAEQLANPPDLLITDMIMPGMSGRVVAELLQERFRSLRVLYISGYTEDALNQHGLDSQGLSFLAKPFTPAMLAERIQRIFQEKPIERVLQTGQDQHQRQVGPASLLHELAPLAIATQNPQSTDGSRSEEINSK